LLQRELEAFAEDRAADRHEAYHRMLEDDYGDVFLSDDLFEIFDESHVEMAPLSPAYLAIITKRLATPR